MYPNRFVAFDIETGGLKTKGECSPITEIAMVEVRNDLTFGESFDIFIKPYEREEMYEAKALEISNISLDMCERGGKEASEVASIIANFLRRAKKEGGNKAPVLVGHNIESFDIPLLSYFLKKFKIELDKLAEPSFFIDTKWWGRICFPDLPGYTLGDCIAREGIDNSMAHRAINDVKANAELFIHLLERMRGEGGPSPAAAKKMRDNFKFQF